MNDVHVSMVLSLAKRDITHILSNKEQIRFWYKRTSVRSVRLESSPMNISLSFEITFEIRCLQKIRVSLQESGEIRTNSVKRLKNTLASQPQEYYYIRRFL